MATYDYFKIGFFTTQKKAENKQIKNLVDRLDAFGEFRSTIVNSKMLNKTPIEKWPIFDICIPYHLEVETVRKTIGYVNLRKPLLFNDLDMQEKILNRKFIYDTMKKNGIPCLSYFYIDHLDSGENGSALKEEKDYIEIDGQRLNKPFVEKPVSARRHDIYIYYSQEMGGGRRKLFRKDGNNSSKYYPCENEIRRDGKYLYERLIKSEKDIKVYAVLSDYCYAEKRKSPNVDGIVERNVEGYEIREYCPLTHEEANISKKLVSIFKQNICGFDILRENEKNSYVIDVNGMSFVKYNFKYYDDAAHILRIYFLREMQDMGHPFYEKREISYKKAKLDGIIDKDKGDILLGVITIFRHGDRTPKQRVKIPSNCRLAMDLFANNNKACELKLQKEDGFEIVYDIFREMLKSELTEETVKNIEIVKKVLKKNSRETKVQIKSIKTQNGKMKRVQIICKWGGVLTEKGRNQCKRYAQKFKKVYKGLENVDALAKHSRVYASDEMRVKESARIFVDTLVGKKDGLTIRSNEEIEIFLNHASKADRLKREMKEKFEYLLNDSKPEEFLLKYTDPCKPVIGNTASWIIRSFKRLVDPKECLVELKRSVEEVVETLKTFCENYTDYVKNGETIFEIFKRWNDINDNFCTNGRYNVSNVPDIYDYLKYDLTHNFVLFNKFNEMFKNAKKLAEFIFSAEYGITNEEKRDISKIIIENLLMQFLKKLDSIKNKSDSNRTFIFFASRSIINALRNFFLFAKIATNVTVSENFDRTEFYYLSHVIIRLYEDPARDEDDPMHYYVNIMFSPGVWGDPFVQIDPKNFKKDKREILNPFVDKMAFTDFCETVNASLSC